MPTQTRLQASLRERIGPVCVAVAASEPTTLFERATTALGESRFLELRFDALDAPGEAVDLLSRFTAAHPHATVLATCRRRAGGGGFGGSVPQQLSLLEQYARAGARLVDLELETLEAAQPHDLAAWVERVERTGAALLVSAHDFEATGDPDETLLRLERLGAACRPAIYKVVTTARRLGDNLRMLRFLESAGRGLPVVGICMGLAGIPSRVLALRSGALFTFASGANAEPTAAGQIAAPALLGEYRAASLGSGTRVYGVAGNPVKQSLSPAMHNAAFRAAGLDAVYLPLHTTSVADLMELVRGLPLAGLSITMPWKVEILPLLDGVDPLAAQIGAVNTVVRREDGRLWGVNTDAAAIVEPLEARLPLQGARVLLLGAGGAARAAAFALGARGAEVSILNRSPESAATLARACGAEIADRENLQNYDVVVNATPAGMKGSARETSPIGPETLSGVRVVYEMVYRPLETPLTRMARAQDIAVITGLEMFAHQGARQWELWTGQEPPLAAMREALQTALLVETQAASTGEEHPWTSTMQWSA